MTTTDPGAIARLVNDMETEQTEMRRVMTKIMWHMRGSISRQEAWTLSHVERNDIMLLISEHKDLTEKTGLPLM